MNNETAYILNLVFSFAMTGLFYCVIPFIIRLAIKKPMENKRSTKYAIINSAVILVLYFIIYSIIAQYTGEVMTPNYTAAIIWFFAARAILRAGSKKDNPNKNIITREIEVGTIKKSNIVSKDDS